MDRSPFSSSYSLFGYLNIKTPRNNTPNCLTILDLSTDVLLMIVCPQSLREGLGGTSLYNHTETAPYKYNYTAATNFLWNKTEK